MHARHVVLTVLAAAVTLTSVASAGPAAAKQRVSITSRGFGTQAVTSRIAFTSTEERSPPQPPTRSIDELYVVNGDGSGKRLMARLLTYTGWVGTNVL